jgi:hypothetical protein
MKQPSFQRQPEDCSKRCDKKHATIMEKLSEFAKESALTEAEATGLGRAVEVKAMRRHKQKSLLTQRQNSVKQQPSLKAQQPLLEKHEYSHLLEFTGAC